MANSPVIKIISVLWLLCLTLLGAWILRTSHRYSLPIADTLLAMTTALPVVAGLITFFRTRTLPSYFLSNVLSFMALLVYETVLATLAGTHIAPREALHCALEEKPVQSQRFASNHQDSGRFPVLWPQK